LGEILNRPNLKAHVIDKYKRLLELFLETIQGMSKFFDENCKTPPIPNGFTGVGGAIAWARILSYHAERYMNFFRSVYVQYSDENQVNPTNVDVEITAEKKYFPPNGYQTILQEFSKKIKV